MGVNITKATLSLPVPKDKILNYEKEIAKLPQVNLPLQHDFVDGLYSRTIFIQAGVAFAGHTHRYGCVNIISKGRVSVVTEEGNKIIEAPCVWISSPGVKRVGYTFEDTVWTTIHSNPENITDIDQMEDYLIVDEKETMLQLQPYMDQKSLEESTRTFKEQKQQEKLCLSQQ